MPSCRSPSLTRVTGFGGVGSPGPVKSWQQMLAPLVPSHAQQLQSVEEEPAGGQASQQTGQIQHTHQQQQQQQEGIRAIMALMPHADSLGGPGPTSFVTAGVTAAGPGPLPSHTVGSAAADDSPVSGSSSGSGVSRRVARDIWASAFPAAAGNVGAAPSFEGWSTLAATLLRTGSEGEYSSGSGGHGTPLRALASEGSGPVGQWAASLRPASLGWHQSPSASAVDTQQQPQQPGEAQQEALQLAADAARPDAGDAPAPTAQQAEALSSRQRRSPLSPLPPPVPPSPKQLQQPRMRSHRRNSNGSAVSASPSSSNSPAHAHALLQLPLPALLSTHQPGGLPARSTVMQPPQSPPILLQAAVAAAQHAPTPTQQQQPHRRAPPFSPTQYGCTIASPRRPSSLPSLSPRPVGRELVLSAGLGASTPGSDSSTSGHARPAAAAHSGSLSSTPSSQQGHSHHKPAVARQELQPPVQQMHSPLPPASPPQQMPVSPAWHGLIISQTAAVSFAGDWGQKGHREDSSDAEWQHDDTGGLLGAAEPGATPKAGFFSRGACPTPKPSPAQYGRTTAILPPPAYDLVAACRTAAAPSTADGRSDAPRAPTSATSRATPSTSTTVVHYGAGSSVSRDSAITAAAQCGAGVSTSRERPPQLSIARTWSGQERNSDSTPAPTPSAGAVRAMLSPQSPVPPGRMLPSCRSPSLSIRAQHMQPARAPLVSRPEGQGPMAAPGGSGGGSSLAGDGSCAWHGPRVVGFLDYSSRYGFGYRLSCGLVGVEFKDGSHMLWRPDCEDLVYLPSDGDTGSTEPGSSRGERALMLPPAVALPHQVQKKRVLLHRFVGCLALSRPWGPSQCSENCPQVELVGPAISSSGGGGSTSAEAAAEVADRSNRAAAAPRASSTGQWPVDMVHLKRVVHSPKGHLLMHMSDSSTQVVFPDRTLLLLGPVGTAPIMVALAAPPASSADGGSSPGETQLHAVPLHAAAGNPLLLQRLKEVQQLLRQAGWDSRRHPPAGTPAGRTRSADCCPRDQS